MASSAVAILRTLVVVAGLMVPATLTAAPLNKPSVAPIENRAPDIRVQRVATLSEAASDDLWEKIRSATKPKPFELFLTLYPQSKHAAEARAKLEAFGARHNRPDSSDDQKTGAPSMSGAIAENAANDAWSKIKPPYTAGPIRAFLKIYPDSKWVPEAEKLLAVALAREREASSDEADIVTSKNGPVATLRALDEPRNHKTWTAYLPLDDAPLPPSLDKGLIEDTVFQVVAFSANDRAKFPIVLSSAGFETQTVEGLEVGTIKYRTRQQLIYCARTKVPNCPIFQTGMGAGTAFLLGDNNTLATALHVFRNWLVTAVQNNDISDLKDLCPPFALKNRLGEIVFNTATGSDTCRILRYPVDRLILAERANGNSTTREEESDYVEIELGRPISKRFLSKGTQRLRDQRTQLYTFGHPGGEVMSDIRSSVGRFREYDGILIEHNALSTPGMSGGPVVLDDGTVVGINISGKDGLSYAYPVDDNVLAERFVDSILK